MLNSSEEKAACGPYMAPCRTSPTVTVRVTDQKVPASTSGKKADTHSPAPAAPSAVTGLRPIRSDGAPRAGMVTRCTAEATSPEGGSLSHVRNRGERGRG